MSHGAISAGADMREPKWYPGRPLVQYATDDASGVSKLETKQKMKLEMK